MTQRGDQARIELQTCSSFIRFVKNYSLILNDPAGNGGCKMTELSIWKKEELAQGIKDFPAVKKGMFNFGSAEQQTHQAVNKKA